MKKHPYLFLESDSRFGWEKMDAYEWCGTVVGINHELLTSNKRSMDLNYNVWYRTCDTWKAVPRC